MPSLSLELSISNTHESFVLLVQHSSFLNTDSIIAENVTALSHDKAVVTLDLV